MKSKLLTVISVFVLTIVSFAEIGIHENRSSLNDHIINPTTKTAYAVKDVGCYNGYTYDCHEWFILVVSFTAGSGYNCNFTGTYGPPYYCTDRQCNEKFVNRKCVRSDKLIHK